MKPGSGGSILSLNVGKKLVEMDYNIHFLILLNGPLTKQFSDVENVDVVKTIPECKKIIKSLYKKGCRKALCNCAPTGIVIPYLKECGYYVISLIHEFPSSIIKINAVKAAELMANDSDVMIFPSIYVKDSFINELFPIKCPIKIKHQGVYGLESTLTKMDAKQMLSNKYNFDVNKKLFINVAQMEDRKGFDYFAKMANMDTEYTYLWVGKGDDNYVNNILDKYENSNLVLTGYIDNMADLADVYKAADVLALTSRAEPFGSIVLEAFLNHTPVIGFEGCGGFNDVVKNDITGNLIKPFDLESFINKLHALTNDKELYNKIIENCYKYAKKSNIEDYCKFIIEENE